MKPISLEEVATADAAPLLRLYRRRFGFVPFVRAAFSVDARADVEAFAAVADQHPVFELV